MFQRPFSFEGRIRRLEYGLSIVIYLGVYFMVAAATIGSQSLGPILLLILYVPLVWFLWAQGAKRCHDIGKSGWWQIIPFYPLVLIFQDGYRGRNEYGPDPKFPEQMDALESETLDGHMQNPNTNG